MAIRSTPDQELLKQAGIVLESKNTKVTALDDAGATLIANQDDKPLDLTGIDLNGAVFSIRGEDLIIQTPKNGILILAQFLAGNTGAATIDLLITMPDNQQKLLSLSSFSGELVLHTTYAPLSVISSFMSTAPGDQKSESDFQVVPYKSSRSDTAGNAQSQKERGELKGSDDSTQTAVGTDSLLEDLSPLTSPVTDTVDSSILGDRQRSDREILQTDSIVVTSGLTVGQSDKEIANSVNLPGSETLSTSGENDLSVNILVTPENLEITRVDSSGERLSDMEWESGDFIRVRWYDNAGDGYTGDANEANTPGLNINRVTIDVSSLDTSLSGVEVTEIEPGIWEALVKISNVISTPGDTLQQVSVQAHGTLDTDQQSYQSAEVAVERIVLHADDNEAEGTLGDDIFVIANNAINFQHTIDGGQGTDSLDYTAVSGRDMIGTIVVGSNSVESNSGLDHLFINIEEIRVGNANWLVEINESSDQVAWTVENGSSVVSVDSQSNGTVDLRIVYQNQLLEQLKQDEVIV